LRRRFRVCLWLAFGAALVLPGCNQIINFPAPSLVSLSPSSVTAGQPGFTLTLTGKGFVPNASLVEWNGSIQSLGAVTVVQNVNVITVAVPYTLIQNPGQAQVAVFTPQPGGGITQTLTFTINAQTNPVPQITALSPSQVYTGAGGSNGAAITILGRNFVATGSSLATGGPPFSTVNLNGSSVQATFVNSTNLQLSIPAADLGTAGPLQISVVNPANGNGEGGGTSNVATLNIVNPVPIITSLTPPSVQAGFKPAAGNPYPILTVSGSNLAADSYITVNGGQRTTLFSGTQLSALLTAADFVHGGYERVAVVTPGPGGGTSNSMTIAVNPTVTAGLPVLADFGPDGVQANGGVCGGSCAAGTPGLDTAGPSADEHGRYIAFASVSNNLAADYVDAASDIFLRDTCLGTAPCTPQTTVVSVGAGGAKANGPSFQPSISTDATQAAFTSLATNLVTNVVVSGGYTQVYRVPTCSGISCTSSQRAAALISISSDGTSAGNGDSYDPVMSSDGRYVAFVSLATNLVGSVALDGITPQVFMRDTCGSGAGVISACTPTTYLISTPDGATAGNGASLLPSISSGGQYVAFESSATNLGASAPNPNAAEEIFVRATCITGASGCTASTTLISTPDASATAPTTPADGSNIEPSITADGRFIAFASTATNLGAGATPAQQVYLRDTCLGAASTPACTPGVRLISTANDSVPGNALSESPSISGTSGQFVAFASLASNLASGAANGIENIYVRNTCGGSSSVPPSCVPATALASQASGTGATPANGASAVPSISADGHTVAFLSLAGNLVPDDTNGLDDIFLGSTSF